MPGFKDESVNVLFGISLLDCIIEHLIRCSSDMKADCIATGNILDNHEDRITDRLVAKYLNREESALRFIPQAPESFDPNKDSYIGRTDIKVVTKHWFKDENVYYTIECKRIDGSKDLNQKYIAEGIARFVESPPKYHSYYKRNVMLGYIVRNLDIPKNTEEISVLQSNLLRDVNSSGFTFINSQSQEYYVYSCQYESVIECIELRHLFYNLASAVLS